MARKTKSWAEKMVSGPPHIDVIDKPFAGIPAGTRLLISSPAAVSAFVTRRLPAGQTMSIPELRAALARDAGAQATCPLTTSIFVRIAAEAAWDELEAGAALAEVTPFWRVVDPDSALAKKLRCGPQWVAQQRAAELASQKRGKP
jgi:hypothetical protein